MYNSDAVIEFEHETKKKGQVSDLAIATFEAFEPFINVLDPGVKIVDSIVHSITKEDWRLNRQYKQGLQPVHRDGRKFNPYLDIVRNIYSPKHVQDHINENVLSYFTGGNRGLGLFYFDTDAHKPWQTDQDEAHQLIVEIFPEAFHRPSFRGENHLLKVRYNSIVEYNDVADELQKVMRDWFLQNQILCDFEVKGTITTRNKSGRLAKLPFTNVARPRNEKDCWNWDRLKEFLACPTISIGRVKLIIKEIQSRLDPELVAQGLAKKKPFIDRDKARERLIKKLRLHGWVGSDYYILNRYKTLRDQHQAGSIVAPKENSEVAPNLKEQKPVIVKKQTVVSSTDRLGDSDGDAFARNWEDLLPFTRDFYRKHKRFPDVEDALIHLRDNGLYSGSWDDRANHRRSRVGQILAFIGQTFDPNKLTAPESKEVDLKAGKFMWWVSQKFGRGLKHESRTREVRNFDPETLSAPLTVAKSFVPAKFIDTFMIVADFCLNNDPLENKAVPTNRFKKIWAKVVGGEVWNQKYFQIIRDLFDRLGVIHIFDRKHESGKAWKWESGSSFPASSWKEEQQKLKHKLKRLNTGVSFAEFIANRKDILLTQIHNSLYQNGSPFLDDPVLVMANGPPPDV